MSQPRRIAAEEDLKPWAAYVVGCLPYLLRISQESIWATLCADPSEVGPEEWDRLFKDIAAVDEALATLALGGQADAAALVELHRDYDRFEADCWEMKEDPGEQEESLRAPSRDLWWSIFAFSQKVVTSSGQLRIWREIGEAVGHASLWLFHADGFADEDFVPPQVKGLPKLVNNLTGSVWDNLRRRIIDSVNQVEKPAKRQTLAAYWKRIEKRHLDLSRLDVALRAALRNQPAPEPVLLLDKDNIVFFGEKRPLTYLDPTEVAILWVLAERSGRRVGREVLKREGRIQTNDTRNMTSRVTHLRKKLKQMVIDGCGGEEPKQLPGYEMGFIKGGRGRVGAPGPYCLELEPGLVRVAEPKPESMLPRLRAHSG